MIWPCVEMKKIKPQSGVCVCVLQPQPTYSTSIWTQILLATQARFHVSLQSEMCQNGIQMQRKYVSTTAMQEQAKYVQQDRCTCMCALTSDWEHVWLGSVPCVRASLFLSLVSVSLLLP